MTGALRKLTTFSIEVEDFALVTYRVEAARVRRHLPEDLKLQTHDADGVEYCFVSTTCFLNRDFRATAIQVPRHTFHESTYRAYVEFRGEPSVYFFGRYLGSGVGYAAQRAIDRNALRADFRVTVRKGPSGYESYSCHAVGAAQETSFTVEARDQPEPKHPWTTGDEHAQFLTFRPVGCFRSSVGVGAYARVDHARLSPRQGILHSAQLDLWGRLEIVSPEEAQRPYSVLVSEGTNFKLHPPLPRT